MGWGGVGFGWSGNVRKIYVTMELYSIIYTAVMAIAPASYVLTYQVQSIDVTVVAKAAVTAIVIASRSEQFFSIPTTASMSPTNTVKTAPTNKYRQNTPQGHKKNTRQHASPHRCAGGPAHPLHPRPTPACPSGTDTGSIPASRPRETPSSTRTSP